MKINYWKIAVIGLVGIFVWLAYSGRSVAQGIPVITKISGAKLTVGPNAILAGGEMRGLSCIAEAGGAVTCYVLSQ
jgi:hypothetical protein